MLDKENSLSSNTSKKVLESCSYEERKKKAFQEWERLYDKVIAKEEENEREERQRQYQENSVLVNIVIDAVRKRALEERKKKACQEWEESYDNANMKGGRT